MTAHWLSKIVTLEVITLDSYYTSQCSRHAIVPRPSIISCETEVKALSVAQAVICSLIGAAVVAEPIGKSKHSFPRHPPAMN